MRDIKAIKEYVSEYIKNMGMEVSGDNMWTTFFALLQGVSEEEINKYIFNKDMPIWNRDIIRIAIILGFNDEEIKTLSEEINSESVIRESKELDRLVSAIKRINQKNNPATAKAEIKELTEKNAELEEKIKREKSENNELKKECKKYKKKISAYKEKIKYYENAENTCEMSETTGVIPTIRKIFKKKNILSKTEISLFDILTKSNFNAEQINEIYDGYKQGLPVELVKKYAKTEYPAEKMQGLKNVLLAFNKQILKPIRDSSPNDESEENEEIYYPEDEIDKNFSDIRAEPYNTAYEEEYEDFDDEEMF